MTKVVCIVGLPGSGKTHLANSFAGEDTCVLDDIASVAQLPEIGDLNLLVITDPNFCLDKVRHQANELLAKKYDEVEWIFFENNPEKCLMNIKHRNDGRRVAGLLNFLHQNYHPEGNVREIWQPWVDSSE